MSEEKNESGGRELEVLGIHQREEDGYFDATKMCEKAGKRWNNYWRNNATQEFLKALSAKTRISVDELIQSLSGGKAAGGGTWIHPLVARNLGQWLSPDYAVAVAMLLEAHHTGMLSGRDQPQQLTRNQEWAMGAAIKLLTDKMDMIEAEAMREIQEEEKKRNQIEKEHKEKLVDIKARFEAYKKKAKNTAQSAYNQGVAEGIGQANEKVMSETKVLRETLKKVYRDWSKGNAIQYSTRLASIKGLNDETLRSEIEAEDAEARVNSEARRKRESFTVVGGNKKDLFE